MIEKPCRREFAVPRPVEGIVIQTSLRAAEDQLVSAEQLSLCRRIGAQERSREPFLITDLAGREVGMRLWGILWGPSVTFDITGWQQSSFSKYGDPFAHNDYMRMR